MRHRILLLLFNLSLIWFKFYFLLFQNHYHTLPYPKTKENEILTKDKIEQQRNTKCGFPRYFEFICENFSKEDIPHLPYRQKYPGCDRPFDSFLGRQTLCKGVRFVQRDLHFQPSLSPTVWFVVSLYF